MMREVFVFRLTRIYAKIYTCTDKARVCSSVGPTRSWIPCLVCREETGSDYLADGPDDTYPRHARRQPGIRFVEMIKTCESKVSRRFNEINERRVSNGLKILLGIEE